MRNSPRFAAFINDMDSCRATQYVVMLEQEVLTSCDTFVFALAVWLAVHDIFNLDYSKEGFFVGQFLQQFVFDLPPDKNIKGGAYLSVATDIIKHC